MAVDIQKLFDVDLPKALAAHEEKARRELGAVFLITITGGPKEGGAWIISALPGLPVSCKRLMSTSEADVSVTMRAGAFHKLLASPMKAYTAMQLATTGEIHVQGVLSVVARLEKLLAFVKL